MQAVRSFSYRLQCNLTFCNQSEWPACTSITKMKWNNSYIKGVCALQFTKCHLVVKNGDILAFLCWWCSLSGNRKEKQKNLNWFVFFCYIVTFCYPFISRVSFVMLLGGMNLKKRMVKSLADLLVPICICLILSFTGSREEVLIFHLVIVNFPEPRFTVPFPAAAGTHIGDVCLQLQHLHHFLPHSVVILSQIPVLSGYLCNGNHEV